MMVEKGSTIKMTLLSIVTSVKSRWGLPWGGDFGYMRWEQVGSQVGSGMHLMGEAASYPQGRFNLQLFAGEKTEPATPRRREEVRKKGQVAKTQELGIALVLVAVFALLTGAGPLALTKMAGFITELWGSGPLAVEFTIGGVHRLLLQLAGFSLGIAAPVMGTALLVGLVSQFLQVGFLVSTEPLQPKLSRLNPLEGARRVFSKRALIELLKACIKISIVIYIVYLALKGEISKFPLLLRMEPIEAAVFTGRLVYRVGLWIGACLLVVALLDYFYQRWEFEQSIRMSKQDIKDELKQTEGDPQVRSAIRSRQRQMARQRMMAAVPTADVVITNPTHIAVALKYDASIMAAPLVVAKGAGVVAARIREVATEHRIPIVENPPVARALYQAVEVGGEIPTELYQAVAEILAYVYRL